MLSGVLPPSPAADNGGQSLYTASHMWLFSGHSLLMAPAEFDGSVCETAQIRWLC